MKNKILFLGSLIAGLMCVQPAQAAIKPTDVPKICAPLFEEDAPQQIIKNSGSFCQKISFYADVLDKNNKEVSKVFVNGYAYSENNAIDSFYWPTTFRFDTKYTKKTPYKVKVLPTFNCSTDECFIPQNKTITLSEGLSAPFKLDLKLLVPKGDYNKQFYNSFKTYIVPEHQSLNIDTAFYFESERAPTIACNNTDKVGCHYADAKFSYGDRYYQTVEAAQQAKTVIDEMKKATAKGPFLTANLYSSITVITHEDGTVTVGFSGKDEKETYTTLERIKKQLNKVYPNKYNVSVMNMHNYPGLRQGFTLDGEEANEPGHCSEAWAAKGASTNYSLITGYATAWRGKVGKNPHPAKNPPNNIVDHMKPCETCDENLKIYSDIANREN